MNYYGFSSVEMSRGGGEGEGGEAPPPVNSAIYDRR